MIPVIYPSTERDFSNNGLGGLPDAISCVVTEQRNNPNGYYLEMEYPVDGLHFSEIAPDRIIYAVPCEGATPQPFRIKRITRPIDGVVHIDAPHVSEEMNRIVTYGVHSGTNIQGMCYNFLWQARQLGQTVYFWLETDITTEEVLTFSQPEPTSVMNAFLGGEGSVLDIVGGEFEFDAWHILLHSQRGVDSGVEIRYGVNMTDIEAETDASGLVTAVVPFFKRSENDTETIIIGDMCTSENADAFSYLRCVALDVTDQFDNDVTPTKADVTAVGETFIEYAAADRLSLSINVKFTPTVEKRPIHLCDFVRIVYPDMGVSAVSKVVETKYNVLSEQYEELTIGSLGWSIVDTIAGLSSGSVGVGSVGGGSAVSSVNGMTGDVVLSASDVGALPSTYTAPVTSVNGMTGDVVVSGSGGGAVDSVNGQTGVVVLDAEDVGALPDDTAIPTKTSDLTNDSGFITSADIPAQSVTSVNGQTGAVVLNATDVGALASTAGVVRYDQAQTLTEGQKTQARANIGVSNASDKFNVFFGTNPNSTTVRIVKGNSVQVTGQEIKDQITVSQGGCILVVTDDQNSNHFVVYDLDDYTTSGAVMFYRVADGYRYTITVPLDSNVGTKSKVSLASGGGSVAYDTTQSLTAAQMRTARRNIGMPGYAVPLYYSLYSGQVSAGALYKINVDGTHGSSPMTFSELYKLYSDDKCFIFAYEDGGNVYKLKTISTSGLTLNMIDGSSEYLLSMNVGSEGTGSQLVGVNKTTVSIGGGTSAKYRVRVSENSGVYSLASGITPSAILSNIDNVVLVQNGFYELSGYFSSPPFFTVIFAMVQVNASSGLDVTTFTLNMDVSVETCTIAKRTVTMTNSGGTATKADLTYTYNNTTNKIVSDLVGSVVTGDNIMTAYSMYGASPVVMRNGYYYHLFSASSAAVEFRRLDNTRKIIVDRWSTTASESAV